MDDEIPLEVKKLSSYMQVPCCMLTDTTCVDRCQHPAPEPLSWHLRLRWRLSSWWSGLRLRVGSWIAGADLEDRDDYY